MNRLTFVFAVAILFAGNLSVLRAQEFEYSNEYSEGAFENAQNEVRFWNCVFVIFIM